MYRIIAPLAICLLVCLGAAAQVPDMLLGINYIETSQTNIPGRIILLSFIYRFRHFPGAKK